MRALLQGRVRTGLNGSEMLAFGGRRRNKAGESWRMEVFVIGGVVLGMVAVANASIHFDTV